MNPLPASSRSKKTEQIIEDLCAALVQHESHSDIKELSFLELRELQKAIGEAGKALRDFELSNKWGVNPRVVTLVYRPDGRDYKVYYPDGYEEHDDLNEIVPRVTAHFEEYFHSDDEELSASDETC